MNYFIFGYVETVLTESVALETNAPVSAIADYDPADNDTGAAAAGQIYWNDLDTVNGNSFTYAAQKFCIINNVDGSNPCTVTFATKDGTEKGFAKTYADMAVVVAAGKTAITPRFSSLFNDGGKVKMTIAGTGAAATKIAVLEMA